MERVAVITYRPNWTGTLAAIADALRDGKMASLTIYVEDAMMQGWTQNCLTGEGVAEKATMLLLSDKPKHVSHHWRDGVCLNKSPYWSPLIPLRWGRSR